MQKPSLFTVLSPRLLDLYNAEDAVVVIIDVFRATSTIATALHNGAAKVIPVDSVEKCIAVGRNAGCITAGERDGKVVDGLQYGNSPSEYDRSFIEGKTLVITTTNGTKLLHMALARGASHVITGSFVNLNSVCSYLLGQRKNVILGCSGWKDRFNLEDSLFAGAVVNTIEKHFNVHCDSSLMAAEMYRSHRHNLKSFIQQTTHWHRLSAYGVQDDMLYCVSENIADTLPVFREEALYAF